MTWADTDYKFKKEITIDHTKVEGDETDFPVLISITNNDLRDLANGGHVKSSNGYDIVFYNSAEDTLLKHEIESYTNTDGTLVFWVKLHSISSTVDTNIYIYYGKSGVTVNPSSTDTWDNNFVMVQHMNDNTTSDILDSTSYNNVGTKKAVNEPIINSSGKIGNSQEFDGINDIINYGDISNLDFGTNDFCFSFWFNVDNWGTNYFQRTVGKKVGSGYAFEIGWNETRINMKDDTHTTTTYISGIDESIETWHYFNVRIFQGNELLVYEDGSLRDTIDISIIENTISNSANFYIGGGYEGNDYHFGGSIDEVRFSNIVRSPEWTKTTYNTQNDPSTFMSWNNEIGYERNTRIKASQIKSIMPSDIEDANSSSTYAVPSKTNGADTFTWIPGTYHTKGKVTFTLYADADAETGEKFQFYEHSIDFNGDRAIYINDDETYIGHGAGDNIGAGTGNTLVGHDAGQANNFSNCVFMGYEAGKNNTQNNVVAVGYQALLSNTGAYNTAVGYNALNDAVTGAGNTAVGYDSLTRNTSGAGNTAIGYDTFRVNTTGANNCAVGQSALYQNTQGGDNTAIGFVTLGANITGIRNTALGRSAGQNTATDIDACVYLGYCAGKNNMANNRLYINNSDSAYPLIYGEFDNDKVKFGDNSAAWFMEFEANTINIAGDRAIYINDDETYVGHGAGDSITAGVNNTLIGHDAGEAIEGGGMNTITGYDAGKMLVDEGHNSFFGYTAGRNTTHGYNSFFGDAAGYTNTTGYDNSFFGQGVGYSNTTGYNNSAIGRNALYSNTIGYLNSVAGLDALRSNTEGFRNTAMGYANLYSNTTGHNNSAMGLGALYSNTTGYNNSAIGYQAGYSTVDVNGGVYLGYQAGYSNTTANRLYINNGNSAYPLIYGEFNNDVVKLGDNSAAWNIQFVQSRMHMKETTTPTAITDFGAIYFKSDNKMYCQTGDGVEHEIAFV